ncbi:CIR protein [Plasmodium chabaudi adami]|uniref:CIR protein n=1 Tax=Plasmodium chabaudi adami TaxID=5826 RepID=A0A1D3LAI5_PLACE|nr:CIR protein [Plasmodium chabaudi adami]
MLKNLCKAIDAIDIQLSLDPNDSGLNSEDYSELNKYCHFLNNGNGQKCKNYEEIIISTFITFLVSFISSNGEEYLDRDKLAEYAILWLCYQLNKKTDNTIDNLNKLYNIYIKGNEVNIKEISGAEAYNSCNDIINNKIKSENIDVKEMSEIYGAFEKLCKLHTECDEKNNNYTSCSKDAQDFVSEFQKLNDNRSITENDSYSQILSTLFNDYNNFKDDFSKNCSQCSDIATFPDIILPQSSGFTSPSSSIEKTLIPVLLAFAIPLFFGIAYKYSLFGFDKRLHRQYLRERIKKIKKKMSHYI